MDSHYIHAFAAKHKNEKIRMQSRSGGAFVAISDVVLKNGGVVYGCSMETPIFAKHIRAETSAERDRMCGSKYVQSDMSDCFQQIEKDLITNRVVLFSGTLCQVKAVKKYLLVKNAPMQKLLLIGILCHGVPSPMVWKDYVSYYEKRFHNKVVSVDFRNKKKFGWAAHFETLFFDNKEIDTSHYRELFYHHCVLRPSCFHCTAKGIQQESDIILADFWGIEKLDSSMDDNKGVSLLYIINKKGIEWLKKSNGSLILQEFPFEKCIQPTLLESAPYPSTRECFWGDYKKYGIAYCMGKYGGYTWKRKILELLPEQIQNILKR